MGTISTFEEYKEQYQESVTDPESFWGKIAEGFVWRKKWSKVLEWDFNKPEVKWFQGGKLNITENCIDRHLGTRANQTALIWEPNNPADEPRKVTYQQLHDEVCKTANMLRQMACRRVIVFVFTCR
jgi:acetyl-CoA synthetase